MRRAAALLMCAAALACSGEPKGPPPAPPGAIPAGQTIGSATIQGHVKYAGAPPQRREIRMSEAACHRPGSAALSEDLIISTDGAVKNAYVHVTQGLGERVFAAPAPAAVMDQTGCLFVPHLLPVQIGQIVEFANSDPVVHNV